MLKSKNGVSIISLTLSVVAISLVTAALVVSVNNAKDYNMSKIAKNNTTMIDSSAYVKIYTKDEVKSVARQAFADNYLSYYDNEVDLEGFEALIIGEMLESIPEDQLYNFSINVTSNGIDVY